MNTRQKKAKMGRYRAQHPNATLPGAKPADKGGEEE